MRNFNQPIAVALASAASLLGSNALAAQAQAEMPVSSPQLFGQCAQDVVQYGDGPSLSANIDVRPGVTGQATFSLDNHQERPIETESGIYCDGVAGVKDTLELKVGSFSETLPNAVAQIAFANTSLQGNNSVRSFTQGSFSYQRACQIAKRQKGTAVRVDVHQKLTYTEEGYPTYVGQDDVMLTGSNLPCRQNKLGYGITLVNSL
jgi:hypothetical protein